MSLNIKKLFLNFRFSLFSETLRFLYQQPFALFSFTGLSLFERFILEYHNLYFYLRRAFIKSFFTKHNLLFQQVLSLKFVFVKIQSFFRFQLHFSSSNTIRLFAGCLFIYLLDCNSLTTQLTAVSQKLFSHRTVSSSEKIGTVFTPNSCTH